MESTQQRSGIGTRLLEKLKDQEKEVFAWIITRNDYLKADGSVYPSPERFYRKAGFQVASQEVNDGKLSTVKIHWKESAQ